MKSGCCQEYSDTGLHSPKIAFSFLSWTVWDYKDILRIIWNISFSYQINKCEEYYCRGKSYVFFFKS